MVALLLCPVGVVDILCRLSDRLARWRAQSWEAIVFTVKGDFAYFHFVIFFFSFLARFSGVCSKGRNARNLALSLYYLNNINPHLLNALKHNANRAEGHPPPT